MRNYLTLLSMVAVAFVINACGSSAPHRISDEEMSTEWSGQAFNDLLIIGVYEDRAFRVSAESGFADVLKSQGITATPSYDLLPDLTSLTTEAAVIKEFAASSHDAALVVATLDPGYDYDVGDYFATRGMVYLLGGEPGAATDVGSFIAWAGSGQYSLYVGLWETKTAEAIWQISTDSETTGSESGDMQALADFVVDTLRKKGLL